MALRRLKIVVILMALANLLALGFLLHLKNDSRLPFCKTEKQIKYIRGHSMEPVFAPEQEISAIYGYYACHKVERGDIVLAQVSNNENPIVKSVKMIPGDKFHVEKNGEERWNIIVNGEILKNSEGSAYRLDEKKALLLESYEKQYGGLVPEGKYYIMGNNPAGSADSTRFGFISHSQILAKVEP